MSGGSWADIVEAEAGQDAEAFVEAEAGQDAEADPEQERGRGSRGGDRVTARAARANQREERAAAGGRGGAMGDRAVRQGGAPQHGGFPQLEAAYLAFVALDADARAQYTRDRASWKSPPPSVMCSLAPGDLVLERAEIYKEGFRTCRNL